MQNDNNIAISVVIPTYNCAQLVGAAVESVLTQTCSNYEIIIVDDGSQDNTRELVAPFLSLPCVRYHYQENRGLPAARNAGAKLSSAEYLLFLDSDDTLPPEALEVMKREMDVSGAAWCLIDVLRIKNGKTEVRSTPPPPQDFKHAILSYGIWRSVFYRREPFLTIGMYDEEMCYLEDWDLYIRLLEHNIPYIYIPRPLYWYIWRDGSIITKQRHIIQYMEKISVKHAKRLADKGDREAAKVYATNMWGLARRYLYQLRDMRSAWRCLYQSMTYDFSIPRILHPLLHLVRRLIVPGQGVPSNSMLNSSLRIEK